MAQVNQLNLDEVLVPEVSNIMSRKGVQKTILGFQRRRVQPFNASTLDQNNAVGMFKLSGSSNTWIDPSSVYMHYKLTPKLTNTNGTGQVVNIDLPHGLLFDSVVTRSKGTEIDRVSKRFAMMKDFLIQTSAGDDVQQKHLKASIGYGASGNLTTLSTGTIAQNTATNTTASLDVCWQHVGFSVWGSDQFINLNKLPLELEYNLMSVSDLKLFSKFYGVGNPTDVDIDSFKMENVYLSMNYVEIDPAFSQAFEVFLNDVQSGENSYYELHIDGWNEQESAITVATGETQYNLPLNYSNLKAVYSIILKTDSAGNGARWLSPYENYGGHYYLLNSKMYPAYRTADVTEAYMLMQEAFNHTNRNFHGSQSDSQFKDNCFAMCQNFEKSVGLVHSGEPVANSLQVYINFSSNPSAGLTLVSFSLFGKVIRVYNSGVVVQQ